MLLVLVRHGIAVDRLDPACPPDHLRPLTDKGVRRTRSAAQGLLKLLDEAPQRVLSSDLLRARQTAAILAEEAGLEGFEVTQALRPWAAPTQLLDELRGRPEQVVLAAGHAPHLDELVAHLAGTAGAFTWLKKASACAFDLAAPRPLLRFLVPPRALRSLA